MGVRDNVYNNVTGKHGEKIWNDIMKKSASFLYSPQHDSHKNIL